MVRLINDSFHQLQALRKDTRSEELSAVASVLRLSTVFFLLLLALLACKPSDGLTDDPLLYRSVWAELYPESLHKKLGAETLQGDFYFAARAETRAVAEARWRLFLSRWSPENDEFEDAMQAYLTHWAELELKLLQHLKQHNQRELQAVNKKLHNLAADFE